MSVPVRVQLSRRKGWRMPENTVKVDRTTKWGNPYKVGSDCSHAEAVQFHRDALTRGLLRSTAGTTALDAALYGIGVHMEVRHLRGKNLACWCPLDQPCHADVLLELANGESA